MDKKYKTCKFCDNRILVDRKIGVCDECLKMAGAEDEIIGNLQAAEKINFAVEDYIGQAKEEFIKDLIKG
ncbi:hypothetical protein HMPREF0072_1309 [Anaerococcus lactolyticus ATCC 51172]|uniref:Uncharacterized protein n=1 Tax=Anaerococcus lactolyticus ATCC 51172 TaxID=525254 RepID=C2BG39_9FIRM|nr:hypothetical protein [Anaerococcus lactolyticus]EEI86154.1 hypothetical protein HMPREF0072_1309 [Anaerococcus lactolyticus ATCC 51172]